MVLGIDAQVNVTNAGAAFWTDPLEWGLKRKLSPREAQSIEMCETYLRKIPTEFHFQHTVLVLERLKDEGLDLHRFCSGQMIILGGLLFESHGGFPARAECLRRGL